MDDKFLTVSEFASKIKVHRLTVIKMIKEGRILAFKLSNNPKSPYRIKESEIERMISFELHKTLEKD